MNKSNGAILKVPRGDCKKVSRQTVVIENMACSCNNCSQDQHNNEFNFFPDSIQKDIISYSCNNCSQDQHNNEFNFFPDSIQKDIISYSCNNCNPDQHCNEFNFFPDSIQEDNILSMHAAAYEPPTQFGSRIAIDAMNNGHYITVDAAAPSQLNTEFQEYLHIKFEDYLDLKKSLEEGNLARVKSFFEEWGSNNSNLIQFEYGMSPLAISVALGNTEIVQYIISTGANLNSHSNQKIYILHEAALKGFDMIVDSLLEGGASISKRCNLGRTVLHYAVIGNNLKVVQILCNDKYKINHYMKDCYSRTALELAEYLGDREEIIKYFNSLKK